MIEFYQVNEGNRQEAIRIRYDMLKVVNHLPDDYIFTDEFCQETSRFFQSETQTTVLAYEGEKVVGCGTICYLNIMPTFDHPTGKRAHIMNIYTDKEHRRQGIAMFIMEQLILEAKQRGVTEISLDASAQGRFLYQKLGFVNSSEGMVLILGKDS